MKKVYLTLIVVISLISCSKNKDDASTPNNSGNPTPTGNSITINSSYQVWVKIDGNTYSKIMNGNNILEGVGADKSIAGLPDTSSASWSSFLYDNNTLQSYFAVDKGRMIFFGAFPDTASFKSFYSPASYSYSIGAQNGIVISYQDSNNVLWSTDQGSGDQSGSSFVITDRKTYTITDYTVVIRATFNCKVYNSSDQSKTLTEGIYVGEFSNI